MFGYNNTFQPLHYQENYNTVENLRGILAGTEEFLRGILARTEEVLWGISAGREEFICGFSAGMELFYGVLKACLGTVLKSAKGK